MENVVLVQYTTVSTVVEDTSIEDYFYSCLWKSMKQYYIYNMS